MNEVTFPALAAAARRLRLNAGDLVEAVLSAMDAGHSEREAVAMSIIEVLQRRGAYQGRLKQAVDDGTIFQMRENDYDERGARRMGRGSWPDIGPTGGESGRRARNGEERETLRGKTRE